MLPSLHGLLLASTGVSPTTLMASPLARVNRQMDFPSGTLRLAQSRRHPQGMCPGRAPEAPRATIALASAIQASAEGRKEPDHQRYNDRIRIDGSDWSSLWPERIVAMGSASKVRRGDLV